MKKRTQRYLVFFLIGVIAIGGVIGLVYGISVLTGTIGGPTTPSTTYSTFIIKDGASGEDISDIIEIDIYTPKESVSFETLDDYYDISNFETLVDNDHADDVQEDLSDYKKVWLVLDADGSADISYWTEDWILITPGGFNWQYTFNAHHRSSDVYGNVLDLSDGSVWAGSSEGNFTTELWFPRYTTTNPHWNDDGDWDITGDWDDLSENTQEKLYDETYWRQQEVVFDLDDNTADFDRVGDYRSVTNVPSIKFDFNDTIGSDGSVTDVNFTLSESPIAYYIEFSSDKLFINFMETFDVVDGDFEIEFEITMGDNITLSNMYFGRNEITGNHFSDGYTFTSLQTLV
jgi:hypothetical protein